MPVLRLAFGLSLLLLSGFATATLLVPRAPVLLRWGWAFGLGSGWLTLGLGAAALIGIQSSVALALPLLPIMLWVTRGHAREGTSLRAPKPRDALLTGLFLIAVVPAFATAVTTPLPEGDGLAIWGFKGRIFYLEGRIPLEYFNDPAKGYSHPEYPLHLPLLLAGLANLAGRWEDPLLLTVFPVFYASLLVLLYGAVRPAVPQWCALLILAGIAPLPGLYAHIPIGYADLPLAMYVAATLAALTRWLLRGKRGALSLAALSAGLGAWTKNEGLVLLVVCWALAWYWAPRFGARRGPLVGGLGLALAIALPWHLFRLVHGIPVEPFALRGWWQFQRVPVIVMAMGREMGTFGQWGGLWILALPMALSWPWLSRRARTPVGGFSSAFLLVSLAAYVAIYVMTPQDLEWHLATSLHRLLLHLLPAAVLSVGAGIEALLPRITGTSEGLGLNAVLDRAGGTDR